MFAVNSKNTVVHSLAVGPSTTHTSAQFARPGTVWRSRPMLPRSRRRGGRPSVCANVHEHTPVRGVCARSNIRLLAAAASAGAAALCMPDAVAALAMRPEPANALSLPTWAIHISSLVEWLVAMGLVWQYADVCGNQKWKGLTWGMLPLHTSGICACTYHFFYNSEQVEWLVALQAGLTTFGNFTLWFAAYRIYQSMQDLEEDGKAEWVEEGKDEGAVEQMVTGWWAGIEDLPQALANDQDRLLVIKLALISVAGAFLVKYGSRLIDAPTNADVKVALAIIFVPTGFNMLKWYLRSKSTEDSDGPVKDIDII